MYNGYLTDLHRKHTLVDLMIISLMLQCLVQQLRSCLWLSVNCWYMFCHTGLVLAHGVFFRGDTSHNNSHTYPPMLTTSVCMSQSS